MTLPNPACPYCGSLRTLPFEKEEDYRDEYAPEVAVYAGVSLVSLLIGLFLISVIYFRIILFTAALVLLFYLKKRKRRRPRRGGDFLCLDCSRFFHK